jgi:hypothetical protein
LLLPEAATRSGGVSWLWLSSHRLSSSSMHPSPRCFFRPLRWEGFGPCVTRANTNQSKKDEGLKAAY